MRFTRLLLAALLVPLAACDSGDPDTDLAPNSFSLRVNGGASETRADAYAGTVVTEEGDDAFTILLGSEPNTDQSQLDAPNVGFVRVGGSPEAGRFELSNLFGPEPEGGVAFGVYIDPSEFGDPGDNPFLFDGFYFSTRGSFTIDQIDDERVVGSFEMTALPFSLEDGSGMGDAVTVSGEFHALISDRFSDGPVPLVRDVPVTR